MFDLTEGREEKVADVGEDVLQALQLEVSFDDGQDTLPSSFEGLQRSTKYSVPNWAVLTTKMNRGRRGSQVS